MEAYMEKKNSYDEWWLRKDMDNMGYLFEYCDEYCEKLTGKHINKLKFLNRFMRSNIRYEMETGHPMLLSESAYDSVRRFIEVDLEDNISEFTSSRNEDEVYCHYQMYWVGWMYAYIHFEEDILSSELVEKLPIEEMLELYYLGHEMDRKAVLERVRMDLKSKMY